MALFEFFKPDTLVQRRVAWGPSGPRDGPEPRSFDPQITRASLATHQYVLTRGHYPNVLEGQGSIA